MGACTSYPYAKTTAGSVKSGGGGAPASESFRRASSIMVMDMVGRIKEYKQAIPAKTVLSENPHCYLCNSESVHIGTCMPRVPDEEDLLPGRIYFLIPLSYSHSPLSLPLLCDLAVKAGSALSNPNTSHKQSLRYAPFNLSRHSTAGIEGRQGLKLQFRAAGISLLGFLFATA
ncbi:hypothetical protein VNO78_08248 [Psophocarpus tetragonolobus]|uniref:Uncharacterized protein n=1 Tax=Psophocarpus tetragonolobus TaxID=3891 RepID=A0AAN9SXM0_PSOTE